MRTVMMIGWRRGKTIAKKVVAWPQPSMVADS
jgi:hypothetical protein